VPRSSSSQINKILSSVFMTGMAAAFSAYWTTLGGGYLGMLLLHIDIDRDDIIYDMEINAATISVLGLTIQYLQHSGHLKSFEDFLIDAPILSLINIILLPTVLPVVINGVSRKEEFPESIALVGGGILAQLITIMLFLLTMELAIQSPTFSRVLDRMFRLVYGAPDEVAPRPSIRQYHDSQSHHHDTFYQALACSASNTGRQFQAAFNSLSITNTRRYFRKIELAMLEPILKYMLREWHADYDSSGYYYIRSFASLNHDAIQDMQNLLQHCNDVYRIDPKHLHLEKIHFAIEEILFAFNYRVTHMQRMDSMFALQMRNFAFSKVAELTKIPSSLCDVPKKSETDEKNVTENPEAIRANDERFSKKKKKKKKKRQLTLEPDSPKTHRVSFFQEPLTYANVKILKRPGKDEKNELSLSTASTDTAISDAEFKYSPSLSASDTAMDEKPGALALTYASVPTTQDKPEPLPIKRVSAPTMIEKRESIPLTLLTSPTMKPTSSHLELTTSPSLDDKPALFLMRPTATRFDDKSALPLTRPTSTRLDDKPALLLTRPTPTSLDDKPALPLTRPTPLRLYDKPALPLTRPAPLRLDDKPAIPLLQPTTPRVDDKSALSLMQPKIPQINEKPPLPSTVPTTPKINQQAALSPEKLPKAHAKAVEPLHFPAATLPEVLEIARVVLTDFEKKVFTLLKKLVKTTPHNYKIYIVGGWAYDKVREVVLCIPPCQYNDIDLVTDIPQELLLANRAIYKVPQVNGLFSTKLNETLIDIIHEPDLSSLTHNVKSRDFMTFYIDESGKVFDPTGIGLAKIQLKQLNSAHEIQDIFKNDPLVILRAIYLSTKRNLDLTEFKQTIMVDRQWLVPDYHETTQGSKNYLHPHRINLRIKKLFSQHHALENYMLMWELGILEVLFPFIHLKMGFYFDWVWNELTNSNLTPWPQLERIYAFFIASALGEHTFTHSLQHHNNEGNDLIIYPQASAIWQGSLLFQDVFGSPAKLYDKLQEPLKSYRTFYNNKHAALAMQITAATFPVYGMY
jgi:tRNA nucleotidyltransferase/poly(A) polymerase